MRNEKEEKKQMKDKRSKNNPAAHERWMRDKKQGRPKQTWAWLNEGAGPEGVWVKEAQC